MTLIRAVTVRVRDRDGVTGWQALNYNSPTVRICEAPETNYIRADYVIHTRLD
jgi:hypothetical protein